MDLRNLLNNKLVKTGSWYTLTNLFVSGISFLTIPIFTRLLTTEDYGMVSLYMIWIGLFSVFISLDLAWSVQRGKFDFEDSYDKYISSILFLSLILFFSFLAIFIVFEDFFIQLTNLPKTLFYFMIVQSYFVFIQRFSLSKFRVEYKYKLVSVINISISITSVLLSIYLIKYVFIDEEYLGKILGSGVLIVIIGLVYLFYFLIKGKELINLKYWKYALTLSVPFIIHNISGVINSQIDRIIINKYVGLSETGIYSFAYSIGIIISVIFMSFYQAYGPIFLEKMNNKEYEAITSISKKFRDIFTVIYAIFLFISPEIIRIMAPESYWEGAVIVPFIFMAFYINFMFTFETNTEYFYKKTKFISLGTLIAAIVNVFLNLIFVPIYGYVAAAITTVISFTVLFFFHYYITKKIIKHSIYGARFHLTSFVYVLIITVFFMIFKEMLLIRLIALVGLAIITYKFILKGEKV